MLILAEKKKGLHKISYDNKTLFDFKHILKLGKKHNNVKPCEYKEDKMASISYTSGSTGKAKPVSPLGKVLMPWFRSWE